MHRVFEFLALAAVAVFTACSGDDGASHDGMGGAGGETNAGGASGTAGTANAGESSLGEPMFPCAVEAALQAKCHRCHQDPPLNDAPFPLLTWEDTHAVYGGDVLIYQMMLLAIESGFMPFMDASIVPPVQPLTADEKTTLVTWLEAGAQPEFDAMCD